MKINITITGSLIIKEKFNFENKYKTNSEEIKNKKFDLIFNL